MKNRFNEIFKPQEKLDELEAQQEQGMDPMAQLMAEMGMGGPPGMGGEPGMEGMGGPGGIPNAPDVLRRLTMGGGGQVEPTMGVQSTG